MPSLLVVIFLIELVVQLINSVGAATVNNLLWRALVALPTNVARDSADLRIKQRDYLKARHELNATSSQDEFARWAKLRRQHDKLLAELEKSKSALEASRAKFDGYLTTGRLVSTKGLQWFLPFWYSREPMFWLPYGWFPYWVEWFASFPRAPIGSVSIAVWQWACIGILSLASETLGAILGLVVAARQKHGVPVPSTGGAEKSSESDGSSKKTS